MRSYSNSARTRPAQSIVFELTVSSRAGVASDLPRTRTFTLDRTLRIGAQSGNHIVIDGQEMGAFHARCIPGGDAPLLVLDGSSASINGVAVRGSVGLIPGDVISIGRHELRVSAHGADEDCGVTDAASWQLVSDDGRASVRLDREVIIGSAATCGIRLTDADIATHHAQLAPRNGSLWIRDFSGGETFVNEGRVRGAGQLEPGDIVRIGPHRFRIDRATRTAGKPSDATAAGAAAEDPEKSSCGESTSVADAPPAEVAHAPAAIVENDEPVEIPADEGLPFESASEYEGPPVTVEAVPTPHVASPSAARQDALVAKRAASSRIEPRVSMRWSARPAPPRVGKQKARWRVAALILALTLVWAVATRPPEYEDLVGRMLEGHEVAASFDRLVDAGRSLRQVAVDLLSTRVARALPDSPDTASVRSERASARVPSVPVSSEQAASVEFSSALVRGDRAAAEPHVATASSSTTTTAESTGPATPDSVSQPRAVSSVDSLVLEAAQLQKQGAIVSPDRRSVVKVLLAALQLEPAHADARGQLNRVIDSLNGHIGTLIANHQFESARTLLAQLDRSGVPVLSNGNVRDRPPYLDAQSWRALAVSSLLVEADALIQQGLIATPGDDNAISRLEVATRIDPANPLIEDMRAKSSGMLSLAAQQADQQGLSEEARRLANLATYVRDGFGA